MALLKLLTEKLTSCNPTFSNLPGFLDERFSDTMVTVSYADTEIKSYKLHRNILAGCSVILHQKLEHHQTLDITFMSPEEFELLILFLYTGDVFFKSVAELCAGLHAANAFHLDKLQSECLERLHTKIREDGGNALLIWQYNKQFNWRNKNLALFELVEQGIKKDYRQILGSELMEKIERNTMEHLLQMESGIPQIEVFRALLRWTNSRCSKYEIERVPKNLQEVAGDLIYRIRYNLIPIEVLGNEIAKSGLVPLKLIEIALDSVYDKEIEVPIGTASIKIFEDNDTQEIAALDQEEWQLDSTCTSKKHSLQRVGWWTTVDTFSWDEDVWSSVFPLSIEAFSNTRWEVQFWNWSNDDVGVCVRCVSLDAQFRTASVRAVVLLENDPRVWVELAAVLQSDEKCWKRFSKKMSDWPKVRPITMHVRVQWTELENLSPKIDFWKDGAVRIKCNWQLCGWKIVTPTAEEWWLHSEPFGRSGALWRIGVVNVRREGKRKLQVWVLLQHLPASVDRPRMRWNCLLSVWSNHFVEQNKDMKQNSRCMWTIVDNVELETRDPLNVNVIINVSRICADL